MHPEFWHERWAGDRIGFHQPSVAAALIAEWETVVGDRAGCAFVPLCGKSLDLVWLRARGHEVAGVELSDIAVQAFLMEQGIPARRTPARIFDTYEADNLRLYRGDFFDLTAARLGPVAAVYDRASLISWAPELRGRYVDHMQSLTSEGVPTLLVTLEYPQAEMHGPPFSVDRREVERLYLPRHEVHELSRRDILATEPRLQARGLSRLVETCYRLLARSA